MVNKKATAEVNLAFKQQCGPLTCITPAHYRALRMQ